MRRSTRMFAGVLAVAFTGGFVGSCTDRHLSAAMRERYRVLDEDRARGERLVRELDRAVTRITLAGQIIARAEGLLEGRELAGREAMRLLARRRR